jgi:hypothetical protein
MAFGMDTLERGLLEVRMELDLVHGGHGRRLGQQAVEVLGHEVAHADGAHLPVGEQLLERPVGVQREIEAAGQRLMQEQQVELIDAKLAGALLKRVQRGVVAVVADPDLRLKEHVIAGDARAADAFAHLLLVEVGRRGVDEAVAVAQCRLDCGGGLLGRGLKDAQAEGGHRDAVVQRQGGGRCRAHRPGFLSCRVVAGLRRPRGRGGGG